MQSAAGIEAVLAQVDAYKESSIAFLSRKLQPRETCYSTLEKEGLAFNWTLESVRYYLT